MQKNVEKYEKLINVKNVEKLFKTFKNVIKTLTLISHWMPIIG